MHALTAKGSVTIRVAEVPLVAKLDALGAAISFVRTAHGDQMPRECWEAMHQAQDAIARAMMAANAVTCLTTAEAGRLRNGAAP